MTTLDYYNKNAKKYFDTTVGLDMSKQYDFFLKYVKEKGKILDFGCGSGRDSLFFKNLGYDVTAIDGSEELCALAREYTGLDVKCMDFRDLSDKDEYDGIWACSSILHVPRKELVDVLKKMRDALKDSGVIYTAFKDGNAEVTREDGRYFNDLTFEGSFEYLADSGLEVIDYSISPITVNTTNNKLVEHRYWNNFILRKKLK